MEPPPPGQAEQAGQGSSPRQPRRGPAPFASFDHDVSDEVRPDSSPESKLAFQLPEIREDSSPSTAGLGVPAVEGRARSASTPTVQALQPAPRIDISRASSSSHQDSRDSSPEMALFTGTASEDARGRLELGFREDGTMELRSSTEELAFLEGAGTSMGAPGPARPQPPAPESRRHSRKDSQGSEAALLVVGRTSRLSSVGSQCSALSAYSHQSRVSRLSVVSGTSRSPSPHKMLLETSFCGPKPIENDPEICVAAVEERLLEIEKLSAQLPPVLPAAVAPTDSEPKVAKGAPATENPVIALVMVSDDEKRLKESRNRARAEERRARSRDRRDDSYDKPEVYRSKNKSKDVIRIKLKPDEDDDDDEERDCDLPARKPETLELKAEPRPARDSRTPSPAPGQVSRKSSFCSLFKSRETIASPESPANANLRRKKSMNDGRSRSKSRDRSTNRGSVLSLFRTSRRSAAPSPAPSSRAASPPVPPSIPPRPDAAALKYYEDTQDGVIHIPLRTPPDEKPLSRPASAAATMSAAERPSTSTGSITRPSSAKPLTRTVLPDGSIIIPLHSPTEKTIPHVIEAEIVAQAKSPSKSKAKAIQHEEPKQQVPQISKEPMKEPEIEQAISPISALSPSIVTPADTTPRKRRERLVFTTNVGSREQVFSTQFSITKTPSVTSEMSGSFATFPDNGLEAEPSTPQLLRDTHIATVEPPPRAPSRREPSPTMSRELSATPSLDSMVVTPTNHQRDLSDTKMDSSESEPSSEAGRKTQLSELVGGEEGEKRGLVLGQESFEDELPYVPTTLPLERSMALPMIPVRERGGVNVAGVERPRPCAPTPAGPPRAPFPIEPRAPPPTEKIKISLPRRPLAASASAPPRSERTRTRSGSAAGKEWIDFEDVPERRKQPKRIQTLPAAATGITGGADVVYSYVEPEHCRCECHAAAKKDDEEPLLTDAVDQDTRLSPQSPECSGAHVSMSVHIARPFTADLDLHHESAGYDAEVSSISGRRH